jgi:hypothetical protein
MTIEKNATAQEIAEIYASLLDRYTKSGETIEGADLINEAADQNVKNIIIDFSLIFSKVTTHLGSRNQIEMLGLIEKIIASSYLAALSEVIKEKQEHQHQEMIRSTINGNKSFGPSAGKSY